MGRSERVAVIGAGAAGLVSARELLRAGHRVEIFEREAGIGGIWRYDERVESDPLGADPERVRVHNSLYASLRTNLPRDLMALVDFPFLPDEGGDPRRFPHHTAVRAYLERFARDCDLERWVSLRCEVARIDPRPDGGWAVHGRGRGGPRSDAFDAVFVCNGHYAEPRLPRVPGLASFPGRVLHSHSYRRPDAFRGERVVVIGAGASGRDLALEIAEVAERVHLCAAAFSDPASPLATRNPGGPRGNISPSPLVQSLHADGTVLFVDGTAAHADAVVVCTGYAYRFPFLEHLPDVVRVDDGRVAPLHRQLVSPRHPTLAFVGLPFQVVPFPLFQVQAAWAAALRAGRLPLPREAEREAAAQGEDASAAGSGDRDAHRLGLLQYPYMRTLAAECGCPAPGRDAEALFAEVIALHFSHPVDYRDQPLAGRVGPEPEPPARARDARA